MLGAGSKSESVRASADQGLQKLAKGSDLALACARLNRNRIARSGAGVRALGKVLGE